MSRVPAGGLIDVTRRTAEETITVRVRTGAVLPLDGYVAAEDDSAGPLFDRPHPDAPFPVVTDVGGQAIAVATTTTTTTTTTTKERPS